MQYGFYSNSIISFGPIEGYKCNAHGYRTHEFQDWNHFCLVFGESNTFGVTLDDGLTFCEQLERRVDHKIFNIGHPGASPEECVRLLYSFGQVVPPQKVIMVWPNMIRRNYQDVKSISRITGSGDEHTRLLVQNTDEMNVAHFLQQVFFVEQWCDWKGSECYHFITNSYDCELLKKHNINLENMYLHSFENHARDLGDHGGHFGRGAHKAFAHSIKTFCF